MALLSEDSTLHSKILPAVEKGYALPRSVIMGEELPCKGIIGSKKNVSQEWLDEMFGVFQNGSLASFYDRYLGHTFNASHLEKILLKANQILKEGLPQFKSSDDFLTSVAAVDVAHNANEYGHHLFETACYLKEQNQLPKECQFMFWRKINPALYEEKELFKQVEKSLFEPMQKIPQKWAQDSFFRWFQTNDSSAYLSQMEKASGFEVLLSECGMSFVGAAVSDYLRGQPAPEPTYRHRPRPRGIWRRGYGE